MKKTFTRLPQEKQDKILLGFLEEFARHDYENASLSRVGKALGIAKGSIYQYFGSKLDLYRSLLDVCQAVKMEYINTVNREDFGDFWAYYRELYVKGIQFFEEKPIHSQMLFRTSQDRSNPELKAFLDQSAQQALDLFSQWIAAEQEQGLMHKGFDPMFVALTVVSQSRALQEYMHDVKGFDPIGAYARGENVLGDNKEAILRFVDQSIQMFRKSFNE